MGDPRQSADNRISRAVAAAQAELEARRRADGVNYRPPVPAAAEDRAWLAELAAAVQRRAEVAPPEPVQAAGEPSRGATVRIYLGIHTRAHELGHDAAARLYLIARHMDAPGRGWVQTAALRAELEGRGLLTWRRIRQVLAAGEGLFWNRVDGRAGDVIRLWRPGRILRALGAGRPTSQPVDIPASSLYGSIADYRAVAVFGAFLAGRRRPSAPISQKAIKQATGGMSERSQRRYRRAAGVTAARTYRLEPAADHQAALWRASLGRRGRVAYIHTDRRGLLGAPGAQYVAISQSNIYSSGGAAVAPPVSPAANSRAICVAEASTRSPKVVRASGSQPWSSRSTRTAAAMKIAAMPHRSPGRCQPALRPGCRAIRVVACDGRCGSAGDKLPRFSGESLNISLLVLAISGAVRPPGGPRRPLPRPSFPRTARPLPVASGTRASVSQPPPRGRGVSPHAARLPFVRPCCSWRLHLAEPAHRPVGRHPVVAHGQHDLVPSRR